MDRYDTYLEYVRNKLRLVKNLKTSSKLVVNYEVLIKNEIKSLLPPGNATPISFSANKKNCNYYVNSDGNIWHKNSKENISLCDPQVLKLQGNHNIENVEAALAICNCLGIPHSNITPLLGTFSGRAHRQELIAVSNGIKFINDSKSTNPNALIQALATHGSDGRQKGKENVILIAGGRNKRMNFTPVIPFIRKYVKEVYLIGELRNHLAELWGGHAPCRKFTSIEAVVLAAIENSTSGDVVLFSPGSASQDMFSNYEERGNIFSNEVRRRLEK